VSKDHKEFKDLLVPVDLLDLLEEQLVLLAQLGLLEHKVIRVL
jgi:hypothetical protein